MPRPHKPSAYAIELQRKLDTLSTKMLQLNATLRMKVLYAERLEYVVCERNKRVDTLYAQLTTAWQRNQKLENECEHLARLVANSRQPLLTADRDTASA